jgi:aspartyl-tRNA(Asn)/glutamyl-tRNA(Gln) amidotransferase subunit C
MIKRMPSACLDQVNGGDDARTRCPGSEVTGTVVGGTVDFSVVPDITRDEVAHLAQLARLAVTEDELDLFAGQLDQILTAVARVAEVAADDIRPTSHAVPLENVYRPDEVRPSLPREAVLAGAPAVEDDKFRVPRILGEEA